MSDLKDLVVGFLDTDDKLADVKKRQVQLRMRKIRYAERLIRYMKSHKIDTINVGSGKLVLVKKQCAKSFNKTFLENQLARSKMLKNPDDAKMLVNYLYRKKPREEKFCVIRKNN